MGCSREPLPPADRCTRQPGWPALHRAPNQPVTAASGLALIHTSSHPKAALLAGRRRSPRAFLQTERHMTCILQCCAAHCAGRRIAVAFGHPSMRQTRLTDPACAVSFAPKPALPINGQGRLRSARAWTVGDATCDLRPVATCGLRCSPPNAAAYMIEDYRLGRAPASGYGDSALIAFVAIPPTDRDSCQSRL